MRPFRQQPRAEIGQTSFNMRLSLCKLCQFADRLEAGNPILVGLFSRMETRGFPAFLDPCSLVIELECEPNESGENYPMEVRFIDEDGRLITKSQGELEVPPCFDYLPVRSFVSLHLPWDDKFAFERGGTYRFDIVVFPDDEREQVLGGETLVVHAMSRQD
jgi:hypothetical protein